MRGLSRTNFHPLQTDLHTEGGGGRGSEPVSPLHPAAATPRDAVPCEEGFGRAGDMASAVAPTATCATGGRS